MSEQSDLGQDRNDMCDNLESVNLTNTLEDNVDTKTELSEEEKEKEKNNRLLFINQSYFVYSVSTLVKLLKEVSNKLLEENRIPENKLGVHEKFRQTCDNIISEYQSSTSLDDSTVDHVKIIKKVFYVLKDNVELIKSRDAKLFTVRNKENKITTIIPGLNINLIYSYLTEEQQSEVWNQVYTMFVTTVSMVYANTSKSRHKQYVLDAVDYCRKELAKSSNPMINVFMGLGTSASGLDLEALMNKDINIPGTEANTGLLGSLGVDKLMQLQNLSDEIKNFSENDVNETIDTLGGLLGNDTDVKDVCSTMVKTVISDLKQNGIENIFDVAKRVSSQLSGLIDPNKMAKTANKMTDLMASNSDKIKDLKDENGNPIGEQLFSQFKQTMDMANKLNKK